MVSKEVINYIEKEGIDKLYKRFEKYFTIVDQWSEKFILGDLLNEQELSLALDQLTGIYMRFHVVAEALDAYKTNKELNFAVTAFKTSASKINVSQIDKEARESTRELRTYRGDFLNYAESAEKAILSCQARLKRQTVSKSALGIDFTGDTSHPAVQEYQDKNNGTAQKAW